MIDKAPTITEVISTAKYFIRHTTFSDEGSVCCYMQKVKTGWDGYIIKLKYLDGTGYYYDYWPFFSATDRIESEFENQMDNITTEKNVAMRWLGVCPKCQKELFDVFSWQLHDVNTCGIKKAVAFSTES